MADDKKHKLGGWMRLWIVASVFWSLPCLFLIWSVDDNRAENIALWIVPCLFYLVLGWVIGWVRRGFAPNQHDRPPNKS